MMDRRARGTAAALKSADVIAASQLLAQLGLSGFELCSLFFFFFHFFFFFYFFLEDPKLELPPVVLSCLPAAQPSACLGTTGT